MAPASKPHALAIPLPAQGHINPLMRFCKTLASRGFLITFVNIDAVHQRIVQLEEEQQQPATNKAAANHDLDKRQVSSANKKAAPPTSSIRRVSIPVEGLDLANNFRLGPADFMEPLLGLSGAIEQVLEHVNKEGPPVTCVISDILMSVPAQRVADKFNIPRIAMVPSSQSWNLIMFHIHSDLIPLKDAMHASTYRDRPADLFRKDLPGLPALRNADMHTMRHLGDDTERSYPMLLRACRIAYESAHTIVVNSFEELEAPAFRALAKLLPRPCIYGVGPLIEQLEGESSTSLWKEEDHCLQWLDQQPPQSVLYISFGSVTLLSKQQFEELLAGLEASGQRFLWAFRPDLVEDASSIPQEFRENTKDRGCIVSWAPQLRVLSHASVGAFLTHCGWNSTTEAIVAGVPMLCWPYFGDQWLDAKFVAEEWKVGLRFQAEDEGGVQLVRGSEVEKVVRAAMEGEERKTLRKNASKLKEAAHRSLQPGGSSHSNIQALVQAFS